MNYFLALLGLIVCLAGIAGVVTLASPLAESFVFGMYRFLNRFEIGITTLPPSRLFIAVWRVLGIVVAVAWIAGGVVFIVAARQ